MVSVVFIRILQMSLAASAVIAAVCLARLPLRRVPKKISCALWAVVLLRLLIPFSLPLGFSVIPDSWAEGQWAAERLDGYVGDIRIFHDNTPEYQAAVQSGRVPVADGEGGSYVVTAEDGQGEPETLGEVLLPALAGVWLAGVLGMLGYSLFAWFRLRRRLAEAVPLRDRIFLCDGIPAPFVLGVFRPSIYLPSDLTEKEQEYVLLHEACHIRRRDPVWKALGYLALCLHWFNPLVWLAFALAGQDMEMSCDEAVLERTGSEARADYAAVLLHLASGSRRPAGFPLAFGEGNPKARIRRLSRWRKPARVAVILAGALAAALAVCLVAGNRRGNPQLLGAEYAVRDVLYAVTVGDEPSTPPPLLYCVTADDHLYQQGPEPGGRRYLGALEPVTLTNRELEAWTPVDVLADRYTVPEITDSRILRVEENNFYLVFQTEDGGTYLGYGWEDPDGGMDGTPDSTRLRRLYRLENQTQRNSFDIDFFNLSLEGTLGQEVDSFASDTSREWPDRCVIGFRTRPRAGGEWSGLGFGVFYKWEKGDTAGYRLLEAQAYADALGENGVFLCPDRVGLGGSSEGAEENTYEILFVSHPQVEQVVRVAQDGTEYMQTASGSLSVLLFPAGEEAAAWRFYGTDGLLWEGIPER